MKPCVFTGSAVAIVTPFCGDGVDLEAFDRLIERQIQGGTDAIVVCGTTGEAATLSYNERMALIERCVRTVDRRVLRPYSAFRQMQPARLHHENQFLSRSRASNS